MDKAKFLIVEAGSKGPIVYHRETMRAMLSLMVSFFQGKYGDETATAWEKKNGKWVPMFAWMHSEGGAA